MKRILALLLLADRCKGGPTITVPAGANNDAAVSGPAPVRRLDVSRSPNGTMTVSCSRK